MTIVPSPRSVTNTTGTRAPESSSSRSAAGLATTATHVPRRPPGHLDDLGADQLVDPQGVGIVERFGVDRRVGVLLSGRPVVELGQR